MEFADTVKAWRGRLNISQAGAAAALGIPVKTLQGWEQGVDTPRHPRPYLIAMHALADGKDKPKRKAKRG